MTPATPPTILFHARGRMTPEECAFHDALARALLERGHALRLVTHHPPRAPIAAAVSVVPNGLENAGALAPGTPQVPLTADERALLDLEAAWRTEATPARAATRRAGIAWFRAAYARELTDHAPRLVLIWNGHHPQERILAELCRRRSTPVLFCERAFVPGGLHVDALGVLAASVAARRSDWDDPPAWALGSYPRVRDAALARSWWDQPPARDPASLRRELAVHTNAAVVLFCGQVDRDVQQLLYNPRHASNLDAFEAFLHALRAHPGVFVLGKHHPKSDAPVDAYRAALARSGVPGVWTDTLALPDALALAHRVAAVNSTVLFEALFADRPVLALGQSLLSGKRIAYDPGEVGAWLHAEGAAARAERWRSFAESLVGHQVYAMTPELERAGVRGPAHLAELLTRHARCARPSAA